MFNLLKKKNTDKVNTQEDTQAHNSSTPVIEEAATKKGFFQRLSHGLNKTRQKFTDQIAALVLGKKQIDAELLEELETLLISADLGVITAQEIIAELTKKMQRKELNDTDALWANLKQELMRLLLPCQKVINTENHQPFLILMIGINGAGKTTTIGKLAHYFKQQNKRVMLAAGDTFRAAAVEQLQTWGERNQIPVIAQPTGADSASVLYDAVQAAKSRQIDILMADTAGRLHNKGHLMEELKKIKRVIQKADTSAPHEIMLVLDASIGQNAINQVKEFHEAIGITSLVITKLDGTAKGGVIFAIAKQFKLPIAFIGVGEKLDDLQVFNAETFVDALFGQQHMD